MIATYILRITMLGVSLTAIVLAIHTLVLYERVQHTRRERRRMRDWVSSHVWRVSIATIGYVLAACYEVVAQLHLHSVTWRSPVYTMLGILLIDAILRIRTFEQRELELIAERKKRDA